MVEGNEQSVLELAREGDLILGLGKDETQKKLRVHSLFLRHASKVFEAMFSPRFKEGHILSSTCPEAIPFPDDNVDAMVEMCSVIHHRNECTTELLDADQIYNVAVAADKYDCTVALRLAFRAWIRVLDRGPDARSLFKAMTAAYIFDDAAVFTSVTRDLVMHHPTNYTHIWDSSISDFLPWATLVILTNQRHEVRNQIKGIIFGKLVSNPFGERKPGMLDSSTGGFLRHMREQGISFDEIERRSCASIIEDIGNVTLYAYKEYQKELLLDLKAVSIQGLCLDCVCGKGNANPSYCRSDGVHLSSLVSARTD